MEIKGKIVEIGNTEQVTEKFSKRSLVLEYIENPSYPEYLAFELQRDKTSLADKLKVGQTVSVHFNLRGRKWVDKAGKTSYFTSLVAWRIDDNVSTPEYAAPIDISNPADDDDLPF